MPAVVGADGAAAEAGAAGLGGEAVAVAVEWDVDVVEALAGSALVCAVDEPLPTFASPADLGV